MGTITRIIALIIRVLPLILFDPIYTLLFVIISLVIFNQYRRIYIMQNRMFGLNRGNPLTETLISLGYGILGGVVASVIFVSLGISLSSAGIIFVWLTALILMIFNPRFLCFSYAGGLVSLLHIIFGFPKINVSAVMGLVAVLHLVESLLIFFNGHRNPMPIYIQANDGKVVGGFSLQRFWPLPFVTIIAVLELSTALDAAIAMPEWWPLMRPEVLVPAGMALVYQLTPVFAGLGYNDLALTSLPEDKAVYSARNLFIYSILLLTLALLADKHRYLEIVAALFAPLGHEGVIYYGQQREKRRASVFTCPEGGVMVLDVYPNSPAAKMGLATGDVILQINGVDIKNPQQLMAEIGPWVIDPKLTVQNVLGKQPPREIAYKGKIPPLGFIPVPQPNQPVYMVMRENWFSRVVKRLLQKKKG